MRISPTRTTGMGTSDRCREGIQPLRPIRSRAIRGCLAEGSGSVGFEVVVKALHKPIPGFVVESIRACRSRSIVARKPTRIEGRVGLRNQARRLGGLEQKLDFDRDVRELDLSRLRSIKHASQEQRCHVRVHGLDVSPDAASGLSD